MIMLGMSARNNRAFVVLGLVLFLTACGDLGMVLPSQGSYRVNAQVDGDYTLDTYSVVTKNSKIRPYFVNSVVNDPDVRGITVFVQDYSGAVVSRKAHYLLAGDIKEEHRSPDTPELPAEPPPNTVESGRDAGSEDHSKEESPGEEAPGPADTAAPNPAEARDDAPEFPPEIPEDSSAANFGEEAAEPPADGGSGEDAIAGTPGGTDYTGETAGDSAPADTADGDYADQHPAGQDPGGADITTGDRDTADTDQDLSDAVDPDAADYVAVDRDTAGTELVDAADRDVSETGAAEGDAANREPAKTETGNTDTADRDSAETDVAKTESIAAPPLPPADIPKAPIPEDETVLVKQLDLYFPEFRIVEDLAIGRYNLVFQVMGEKEILYKTFKPIYFIGDAKFTLGEIQSFLPVEITGGRLIPPGINVMLTTEVSADPRLDPYIIWHSGKKIIAQGRLSEGANALFWKTPEQTGFHSIRVEVFPLLPGDRVPGNMIGKIKELSLPVSSRSEGTRYFRDSSENPGGEFIGWYQFWGTLDDTKAPSNPERKLVSLYSQAPRWMPIGSLYGLLVGRDDVYTLPGAPFTVSGDEQGTGQILLHLGAPAAGSIVSLRFAGREEAADPEASAELDLSFEEDALILRIASMDAFQEESLEFTGDEENGFVTVIVKFAIAPDHFEAELLLEDPPATTGALSIALAAAVSGEGSIRFGEYLGQGRRQPAPGAGKYGNRTMALNELAFSYARTSILPEEEPSESGLPETLAAEEEYPDAEPEPPSSNAL
jgi:hypothetical protein